MATQFEKAETLMNLHRQGGLLLPNAWDIASARIFEDAGFPAIATTSGGIAFANGYPDGQKISRDEMLGVVGRIAAAVDVPVTADVEAGYGDVAGTIRAVIAAGAVGVNLEDGVTRNELVPIETQAQRITEARAAAGDLALVINARIDSYLFQVGEPDLRLGETLMRAKAYMQAGASSIFVPGVHDPALIQTLVREIAAPLNILAGAGAPSAPELFKLGVARISIGSAAMLATMGLVREIAKELRETGTYGLIGAYPFTYPEAYKLFS